MSYVNNLRGTRSVNCHKVAKEIWKWALERSIYLSVEFLPGVCNTAADAIVGDSLMTLNGPFHRNYSIEYAKILDQQKSIYLLVD